MLTIKISLDTIDVITLKFTKKEIFDMRDKIIQIRVSQAENQIIEEKAKALNITKSDYLRTTAITKDVKDFKGRQIYIV